MKGKDPCVLGPSNTDPLRFKVEHTDPEYDEYGCIATPGTTQLELSDREGLSDEFMNTTGAKNPELALSLIKQLIATLPSHAGKTNEGVNSAVAILRGISPSDELEGTLACQMVAVHSAAIEMFRRAMVEGQSSEGISENINRAVKLTRTYTMQMEALTKYRNRGGQQITVQHVQVNNGGQAVVGNVNKGG